MKKLTLYVVTIGFLTKHGNHTSCTIETTQSLAKISKR